MSIRRFVATLLASGILCCVFATSSAAQVKVLIDGSRDGGVWWAPQAGPKNPNLPHQGKPLADFLRAQGMEVTELGSPLTVTCALLTQFDLVFVVDVNVPTWSAAEISAYNGFVLNGGRLIYLTEFKRVGDIYPLGESFGLRFTGETATTNVTQFAPHPITAGVTSLFYGVGSLVTAAPPAATMLGFLAGTPVMGIMPIGAGRVFFLGDTNGIEGIQGVPQRLVTNLLTFMLTAATRVEGCGSSVVPPGPPMSLSGSVSGSVVTLSWTGPSSGGAVASYVIEAGVSAGDSSLAVLDTRSNVTAFTASSVPRGTYFIRVKARNTAGTSQASNEVVVVVGAGCSVRPQPPLNANATILARSVTLTWNAPVDPVIDYVVEAGSSPGASNLANFPTGNASTSLTASVLPGTYFVRIRARNACGTSQASNEVVVTVP